MAENEDVLVEAVLERLAAADAAAEAYTHYQRSLPWYRRWLDSRVAIVILVAIGMAFLGYSVWVNQQAITRSDQQAVAAKKQAEQAARGQLAAIQLICTMERDIRRNSRPLTAHERADLVEYDKELQCADALKRPHQRIVVPNQKAQGGGQGGVHTPPSHPTTIPEPRRQSSPSPSSSPSSRPTRTHAPRPSPTPTSTCVTPGPTTVCLPRLEPVTIPMTEDRQTERTCTWTMPWLWMPRAWTAFRNDWRLLLIL